MATFCCDSCKEAGSCCDDCKNFIPNQTLTGYSNIDGTCKITEKDVTVLGGYNCDDFICRGIYQ